jgi:hypothetical protein
VAFGGGGSAIYTAQLQIDTRQAQAALSAFGNQMRTSMRRVSQETKQASVGATIGLERLTKNLAGPGLGSQQFRVASAGAKATKTSFDNLTASQIASMKGNDKLRVSLIGVTRAFADQKKMGQVTSQTLRTMAADVAMIGRTAKTQADRNMFKGLTDDLVAYADAMDAALNDVGRNKAIVNQAKQRVDSLKLEADQLKMNTAYYKDAQAAMRALAAPAKGAKGFTSTAPRGGILGRMGMTKSTFTPVAGPGGGKDSDLVRGQMMPERSKAAAKALLNLSSAAQGAMIGVAALDGNIVGLGFSLIFLSYGIVTVAVAFAALTVAMIATERFFKMIITQGAKAGTAMEKLGTQMAGFFKSAAKSQEVLTKASGFAAEFGLDPAAAQQVTYELEKMGMATKTYMTAMANASAATGQDIVAINEQFLAIQKANAADQKGLIEQFSKDFDLSATKYASTLELAIALNERFAGSAEAAANTNAGIIAKIKAAWFDFVTTVGSVLVGFFKPILEAGLAFVQSMLAGFKAARDAGIKTGDLNDRMLEFANTIRMITPYLMRIGWVLGKVVYYGLLIMAKIVKVVADTLIRLWNKIKPVIDTIRALIPYVKEIADKIINWYKANKDLIDGLLTAIALLFAFEGGMRTGMAAADLFAKALGGVWGMLVGLWNMLMNTYVVKFAQTGIEAITSAIRALMTLIGQLAGKTIQFASSGIEGIMSALRGIGGLLDDIAKKAAAIKLPGISGEPGTPGAPGTPGTTPAAPKFPAFNFDNWPAMIGGALGPLLAQAITLAMAHPLVLAALAAAALVIGAALFPKETGFVTSRAADWIGAAIVTIIGALATMYLRIIDKFIELQILIRVELAKLFVNAWLAVFDLLKETVQKVFGGLKDIIVGIITGDWERAVRGALKVLDAIFIDLPKGLLTILKDTWVSALTETVPVIANALWEAFKYVTEPLVDIFKEPFTAIWEWMKNWWAQFSGQWVTEKFDASKRAFKEQLANIKQAFKDIFDFQGSDSIGRIISGAFEALTNFVNRMPNPFGRFMDLMEDVIEKARRVKDFVNAVLPGNPAGGGGSSSGGGGQQQQQQQAYWVPAQITDWKFHYGANGSISYGNYAIATSHWSDQGAGVAYVNMPGLQQPDLSKYALGGRVPGRPGQKVPVLAEAGEVFLGAPNLARASGREAAALGGGGGVNIYLDARGSVMTNDVVDELANQIFAKVGRNLSGNRGMTFHRING